MRIVDATSYNSKTSQILTEGYQDLTESQKIYLGRWEKELWPLLEEFTKVSEANLTADEIQSIFQGAEKQSIASGDNKTLTGKVGSAVGAAAKLPVDIAKKVDAKINQLGRMAQEAGPIKNMDAKFEELKKKIGEKDSKIVAGVKRVSDWAKDNPGKASLAVGILTTIAAFAGGPAGGAAAGLILRASKDLLQGEKLSTAVGKSLKTAAYGALAGMAFRYISDQVLDNVMTTQEAQWEAMEKGYMDSNLESAKLNLAVKFGVDDVDTMLDGAARYQLQGNYNAFYYDYDVIIAPDQRATFSALKDAIANTESFSDAQIKATMKFHDFMQGIVNNPENQKLAEIVEAVKQLNPGELTSQQTDALLAAGNDMDKFYDAIENAGKTGAAAIQGAAQTVDARSKKAIRSKAVDPEVMKQLELDFEKEKDKKENIDYEETVEYLYEQFLLEKDPKQGELPLDNPNSLGSKLKRGIGKAASAVGGGIKKGAGAVSGGIKKGAGAVSGSVKSTAKELGQKITAKKLNKAWEKMGKPTDSGSIYNILSNQGVSDDNIKTIGQEQKVALTPTSSAGKDKAKADAGTTPEPGAEPTPGADSKPTIAGSNKGKDKTSGKADAPTKGAPGLANRMAGTKKQGHTWMGGQWVDDKTGKIGSTAKLGNPLVSKLAQEIKASGPEGIEQITKLIGTASTKVAPVKKPVSKAPVKTAPKKKAVKDVDPTTPGAQKKYKPMAGNYGMSGNKKPNVKVSKTLQKKTKNPKA
tara:strand:- start:1494 stop:3752 length:2259 start_codon:yes stop_codon:yes gene_type:complete